LLSPISACATLDTMTNAHSVISDFFIPLSPTSPSELIEYRRAATSAPV
jgi:hypothetical protein